MNQVHQPRTLLVRGLNAGMRTAAGADELVESGGALSLGNMFNSHHFGLHTQCFTITCEIILCRQFHRQHDLD